MRGRLTPRQGFERYNLPVGEERSGLGTPLAASLVRGLNVRRIMVAMAVATIATIVLAGCFHHGQKTVIEEYSPPPLSRAPIK
jgi:hypothetical protein